MSSAGVGLSESRTSLAASQWPARRWSVDVTSAAAVTGEERRRRSWVATIAMPYPVTFPADFGEVTRRRRCSSGDGCCGAASRVAMLRNPDDAAYRDKYRRIGDPGGLFRGLERVAKVQ